MILETNNGHHMLKCDKCEVTHTRTVKHYNCMKKKYQDLFDKDYCNACWRPILNNRPWYKEKMKNNLKLLYASDRGAIIKNKISSSLKAGGVNVGEKNAMKRPEVRAKVSATRTEMMKSETERLKYRQGSIDAHARGCYIGTKCGQTKWYDYVHSSGTVYKVQGTWELKFIAWLDQHDIDFLCHRGRIPYIDHSGILRNYYPDFYLIKTDTYIDVKGDFWYNKSKQKFDILFQQYPKLKLEIYNKAKLQSLGIDV